MMTTVYENLQKKQKKKGSAEEEEAFSVLVGRSVSWMQVGVANIRIRM